MDVLLYCCRRCRDVLKEYGLERWCTDASPDASRGPVPGQHAPRCARSCSVHRPRLVLAPS